jgi:hypothetical protein
VLQLLERAMAQQPNAHGVRDTRWVVVRNTYRELDDTTRKTFDQWLGAYGTWRESDFAFEIDKPLSDGTRVRAEILFRALDKPQDVKKLLSLEITGAYVNELREVPKVILDGLTMRVGRYPAKVEGGPSWFGVWADTNPWAESSEYAELFQSAPEGFALFRQPSGLSPEAENRENLPPRYYERMCAGKDSSWIDEYVHGKNPRADKGSVYGELLSKLAERGGVCDFDTPTDGTFVNFDLGVSDSTSIFWWRVGRHGVPDIVDWYEASGEPMSHYFDVLDCRGWKIRHIWLPHDARHRTFQTGVTTLDQFLKHYGTGLVGIGPEVSIEDGLSAARWMLEQPIRIHKTRCEGAIKRLKAYRFAWDEDKKVYSKKPVHDWTSHTADNLRYVALVAKATADLIRERSRPAGHLAELRQPTIDEVIRQNVRPAGWERI